MAPAYRVDEMLRVRENVKDSVEVMHKINNSEAGIKGKCTSSSLNEFL